MTKEEATTIAIAAMETLINLHDTFAISMSDQGYSNCENAIKVLKSNNAIELLKSEVK